MKPEEAERVMDLVAGVRGCSPDQQPAFLAEACAGDEALRAEVESLLGFQMQAQGFLEEPAFNRGLGLLAEAAQGELKAGDTLGDCRVVSLLGVGGMGEVYLADDTALGRRVALKLIQRGRRGTLLSHFRHERRVLAGLNHPNIARLYGGAVTAEGRAYLVMEYVEGERLDRYCQDRGLDVAGRLVLFRKVCAAVGYAHQNLVVHRDLKPANIRVTPEGEPKLLDFGIAKLLDPEGTTARLDPTMTMQGVMTPEYASPEQIKGEPITTASDVYSLGVVLFELLTGQRPYVRLKSRRPDELARAICEEEPPRPSTVANPAAPTTATATVPGGLSPAFRETAGKWRRQLEGDLDNIVSKALQKEPGRRYPSVLALSEDIRRHCAGLPVTARKDTLRYRADRFVRRNKVGVAAGALVVLALVAGLIVATWQARVALRERDRAHLAQRQAERLNAFLEALLGSADASHLGKDVKVAQVLDAASQSLDRELAAEPEVLAQAHQTLYRSYHQLGLFVPAEQHARAALALERRLHGADDPATIRAEISLAGSLCDRYHWDEAKPLLNDALAMLRRQSVPDHAALADVLGDLCFACYGQGHSAQGEPFAQEALIHAKAAWGEQSSKYASVLNEMGNVKIGQWDYAGAESIYRREIALQDRLAPDGERSIGPLMNLCISLFNQEKLAEMRLVTERLERDSRRLQGEKSIYFAVAIACHAIVDASEGSYGTAIPLFQAALPTLVAVFPPGQTTVVQCRGELGLCLTRTGQAAEGEPFLRAALADGGQVDRHQFAHTFGNLETALGECLLTQGRYAEAEGPLRTGYEDLKTRLGAQSPLAIHAAGLLHDLYTAWDKPEDAAHFPGAHVTVPAAQTP